MNYVVRMHLLLSNFVSVSKRDRPFPMAGISHIALKLHVLQAVDVDMDSTNFNLICSMGARDGQLLFDVLKKGLLL